MPIKDLVKRAEYNRAYRQKNKKAVTDWKSQWRRDIKSGGGQRDVFAWYNLMDDSMPSCVNAKAKV